MSPFLKPLAICLVFLACAAPCAAATSPEALVKEYMKAIRDEGMITVSRYIHPDELKRFKDMLMPMFRKDAADKSEVIHGLFGEEATLASVEAMPGTEFMDAFMRLAGEQLKDTSFTDPDIIGTVKEKEVVHVVARLAVNIKDVELKKLTVISTRRAGKEWKLLLSVELEGLAAALAAQP